MLPSPPAAVSGSQPEGHNIISPDHSAYFQCELNENCARTNGCYAGLRTTGPGKGGKSLLSLASSHTE